MQTIKVNQKEKETQNRVIKFFQESLGYDYLGNWEKRDNSNIEEEYLIRFLQKQGYSEEIIKKAISELKKLLQTNIKVCMIKIKIFIIF